jgi:hypothetical protein
MMTPYTWFCSKTCTDLEHTFAEMERPGKLPMRQPRLNRLHARNKALAVIRMSLLLSIAASRVFVLNNVIGWKDVASVLRSLDLGGSHVRDIRGLKGDRCG